MPATSTEADADAAPADSLRSFLDEVLGEQQRLQTPVARFAAGQDRGSPALAPVYRDLIPLTRPGPGQQYAFEVDLDSCTGCKACVSACHSLNGLDDGEMWRDVGLMTGPDARHPFTQTITTACHHCADPGCLNGCPVLAYEKDPATGIVRHLGDQCIGCGYCVLKCPYDVPKYNHARGIVRKCDMCQGRLEHGEAPACVQGCPTHAIRVVTVSLRTEGGPQADTSAFLAGAPDPAYTQPTTRYVSKRGLPPDLAAADAIRPRLEPPHWPLVIALTLFALAAGAGIGAALPSVAPSELVRLGWLAVTAGIVTSIFHLGQPQRAWRVFLGLRRSWLSRETVLFGAWWAALTAAAWPDGGAARRAPLAGAALLGLAGFFCSVMVYVDTRRHFWRLASTAPRFFGSALVLGLIAALAAAPAASALGFAAAAVLAAKLAFEAAAYGGRAKAPPAAQATARLLRGPLRTAVRLRLALGLSGGIALPLAIAAGAAPPGAAWFALGLAFLGELAERYLFFRAVVAPRMPGIGFA